MRVFKILVEINIKDDCCSTKFFEMHESFFITCIFQELVKDAVFPEVPSYTLNSCERKSRYIFLILRILNKRI